MIAAVQDVRKAGKLSITFEFVPTGRGTVNVEANFKAAKPEHSRSTTTFFVGSDLSLQRNDPSQPRLPLREVADNQDPVRVVNETR
jgi:hypothetical protein